MSCDFPLFLLKTLRNGYNSLEKYFVFGKILYAIEKLEICYVSPYLYSEPRIVALGNHLFSNVKITVLLLGAQGHQITFFDPIVSLKSERRLQNLPSVCLRSRNLFYFLNKKKLPSIFSAYNADIVYAE